MKYLIKMRGVRTKNLYSDTILRRRQHNESRIVLWKMDLYKQANDKDIHKSNQCGIKSFQGVQAFKSVGVQ